MMQRQLGESQIKQGKNVTGMFYEKVAEGLLANAVRKIQAQGQIAGQLADSRERTVYI
jgi:hypothetical protein